MLQQNNISPIIEEAEVNPMTGLEKLLNGTDIKNPCQLSKRSGVERATISRLLRGQIKKPEGVTLYKIAKAVGKPMEMVMEAFGIEPQEKAS